MLAGGLALPFGPVARAQRAAALPLSDMHFHSFFGPSIYHSRPVAATMAAGGATLVAWSLVGDLLWLDGRTLKPKSTPKPGEAMGWLEREIDRIKAHVAEQGLKLVLTPKDVDAALAGTPSIVLAVEGAQFVEDPAHVRRAFEAGVRHLQVVHYVPNVLGDRQTDAPVHNGLSRLGLDVVSECNRLGMLVDLAHLTPAGVTAALSVSRQPMVWSHGSVTEGAAADHRQMIWKARQLPLVQARSIAKAGGVVGLWGFAPDVGVTVEGFGNRLLQLADWLGDEHVGFGTDINGLGKQAVLGNYADVRRVVDGWQARGVADARIRRIASANYGRVLKAAMQGRRGA